MKKIGIMLYLLVIGFMTKAQVNLVPNFGFEQLDSCPDGPDEIDRCTGWQKFSDANSTPDYYNACNALFYNVPNSFNGYQPDHRNCGAYAGLVNFVAPLQNYREFIGIQLSQPLIIGQKYFLSLYTVMAEIVNSNNYHLGMPASRMGIRLSTIPFGDINPCPINNFAHIYSSSVINDSINWIRISGNIIADSSYDYLIVGNFFNDMNTDTMHFNCDSCLNTESYYYVDDVCLSTDSLLCNGGIDNLPCDLGISEGSMAFEVTVHPNPVIDNLQISFPGINDSEINLVDLLGNKVYSQELLSAKDCNLNFSSISQGCYLLQVINKKNGKVSIKKIIKI